MIEMKKLFSLALSTALALSVLTGCGGGASAPSGAVGPEAPKPSAPVKLQISTASTSGSFYQEGLAFAQTVNSHSDYLEVSSVASSGSNENVNLLRNGETSIGCVQSDVFIDAVSGTGTFEADGPYEDLMVIMPVSSRTYQMLVQSGSSISSMGDLAGKHLGVGEAGSGNAVTINKVLSTFGLDEGKFTASAIGPTEALSALQNRQLDWTLLLAAYPVSSVTEALTTGYAQLMGLTEEEQAQLLEAYPFMSARTLPAGTYPGQDEDLLAVGHNSYIAATSALSEEIVYDFVMAVYGNLDEVFSYCSSLEKDSSFLNPGDTVGQLVAQGVKIHPGAEKALKELGYLE